MYLDDETRLLVMRDAARRARATVTGCTRDAFAADALRQDAVAWCLTTLGEAASKLSPATRAGLGAALSPAVVGVYERFVRGDYEANPAVLWSAATERLPTLCKALERALATPVATGCVAAVNTTAPRSSVLAVDRRQVAAFCEHHGIRRLAVFGSALGDGFGTTSDVDLLVDFAPDRRVSLLDMVALERELTQIVGRPVDLRTPEDLSPYIRQRILDTARVIYERG
jgi:uncharacterized protein